MGGVQAVSGAASIVFAAGLSSSVIGAPIALGIATIGFDNLQAGSNALLTNQPAKTLGGKTLELTGLSSENAELAYSIFDLVATAKVINLALSKGSYQMLQVTVSSGVVERIKLLKAKINQRHTIVAGELKVVEGGEGTSSSLRQTGAREFDSVDAYFRAEAEALDFYKAVRISDNSDVLKISQNTGWSQYRVERVKDHVFIDNTHILEGGKIGRFDPYIEISDAWKRLQSGNYKSSDINLLKHEYFESKFEKLYKTDYTTAHKKTILSGRDWKP